MMGVVKSNHDVLVMVLIHLHSGYLRQIKECQHPVLAIGLSPIFTCMS